MQTILPTLATGERVTIRRFTRADVDEWVAWPNHADPLFQDYNSPDLSRSERDVWYADRAARPDHAMFAIADLDGQFLGRLFLRQMDANAGSAVLGIDLRADLLGQGLGTDALRAFCRYYFTGMGYRVLRLDHAAFNRRAQRVYEKLGWVRTGEHWSTYPWGQLPDVFTDPRFAPIRDCFRRTNGAPSVLHYDMELTRERWEQRETARAG